MRDTPSFPCLNCETEKEREREKTKVEHVHWLLLSGFLANNLMTMLNVDHDHIWITFRGLDRTKYGHFRVSNLSIYLSIKVGDQIVNLKRLRHHHHHHHHHHQQQEEQGVFIINRQ